MKIGGVFIVWIVLAAALFLQHAIHAAALDRVKVWEGTCTFKEWGGDEKHIRMIIDCNGQDAYLIQPEVILAYLKNPAPFSCKRFRSGQALCESAS